MPDKPSQRSSRRSRIESLRDADFRERDDRVTYLSTNKKTQSELVGSVPPNSSLSATLALVAAAVQTGNIPRHENGPARLSSAPLPRGQIQATADSAPYIEERESYRYPSGYQEPREVRPRSQMVDIPQQTYYSESQERPANMRATYIDELEDYHSPPEYQERQEIRSQSQRAGDVPRHTSYSENQESLANTRRFNDGYSHATRYGLDRKVAYHAKNADGELYVSAPTESNEALLFDEMARRMAKFNVSVNRITSCDPR
jgi:hypothetical protein